MNNAKKIVIAGLFLGLSAGLGHATSADDAKWIGQCLKDNAGESAGVDVITKYCTCMNDKMPESATVSISTWEKSHPVERKACDRESGWR